MIGESGAPASTMTSPRSLLGQVGAELWSIFTKRRSLLLGMVLNAVLATGYIAFTHQRGRFQPSTVPFVAAGFVIWILADVLTTNQLGVDADRVLASLAGGTRIRRILVVKNLALAILLLVIAVAVSVGVSAWVGRTHIVASSILLSLCAVFGWLALGNLASVVLPYRPVPLKERWKRRRSWLRWAVCVAAPYILLVVFPILAVGAHLAGKALFPRQVEHHIYGLRYALVVALVGVAYWVVGVVLAGWYAGVRQDRFLAGLRRPD